MSRIRATRLPHALAAAAIAVLATTVLLAAAPAGAAQVGLGTADSFAVLAGAGITPPGATTITGDVGTFPTTSETGFGPGANAVTLTGTNHGGDSVTQGAKNDLVTAYDDAAGRLPETAHAVELGGDTLLAGNYTSGTFGLTGTLTLDAQGNTDAQFVFKAASTLITASNSRVLLINGADPCRVVWQVGSSATFNTGTQFVGDVLALTDISALNSATFQGRLLARNGAVTLDTNTITRGDCLVPAGAGTTSTTVAPGATTTTAAPVVTTTTAAPVVTTTTAAPVGATTTTAAPLGTTTTTAPLGTTTTTAAPLAGVTTTTEAALTAASIPAAPVAPAAPATPAAPAVPGTPATPAAPATPGAPVTPSSPGAPGLPATGIDALLLMCVGVALITVGSAATAGARR
jgi:type VI secretion system secreted protein VgrG